MTMRAYLFCPEQSILGLHPFDPAIFVPGENNSGEALCMDSTSGHRLLVVNLMILSTGQSSNTVAPSVLAPLAKELVSPVGSTAPSDLEYSPPIIPHPVRDF